jgi:acetylornithine deacetylase
MNPQEALALANQLARDDEIDRLLVDVLRAPSPQTEKQEADPNLKNFIAEFVAPRLKTLTGSAGVLDGMGNLIWRSRAGQSGDAGLLLMGYAMTFAAGSMAEPFSGTIVDGGAYGIAGRCAVGRGACEQKGALAAMIYAAAMVSRSKVKLSAPLMLAVSLAGETGRHDAAKFMLEHDGLAAKAAILGLGTGNRSCLGNKGRIDVEITVRGKSAHSSMPWQGLNAVDGARRAMERLDRLPLGDEHSHLGNATLTITQINSAPENSHTVPDSCRLVLDRRLLPGDDPDQIFAAIQSALAELAPWEVEVKRGAMMFPSEVASDCAIAAVMGSTSRKIMGIDSEPFYSPAALDAGYLNRAGIETIMFGPGDLRLAHTDYELVSLQEVRDAARIYAAAAFQLLA